MRKELKGKKENLDQYAHVEDVGLKEAAGYFGEEVLGYFGVHEKVKRIAPTEAIHLDVHKMYEDFDFEMENGDWYHFEFESDRISKDDLRRFRVYEAVVGYREKVNVITYVVCTANAESLLSELNTGLNTYRVKLVHMKERDAASVFAKVQNKETEAIGKKDLVMIVLSPLMGGKMPLKERFLKGFTLLQETHPNVTKEELRKLQSILYLFAQKFLKPKEVNEVKEAISMTILGQMLVEDGMIKGKAEDIFDLLELLGTASGELREKIASQKDLEILKKWVKKAARASSIEEFAAGMDD